MSGVLDQQQPLFVSLLLTTVAQSSMVTDELLINGSLCFARAMINEMLLWDFYMYSKLINIHVHRTYTYTKPHAQIPIYYTWK